jgi:hypothetical protein
VGAVEVAGELEGFNVELDNYPSLNHPNPSLVRRGTYINI